MALGEQLRTDLNRAMKQGDKVQVSTLRLLRAALKNREIAKGGALEEEEALEVLIQATKQRQEAIALAREYGREDVACQEARELEILQKYLPAALSLEELQHRIEAVVQEIGAVSLQDMGRVMTALMPAVKGRADGRTVSRLVRERLTAAS